MQSTPDGTRVYVNRWPSWLDLENGVYRPLLLKLLPSVCETVCRVPDRFADTVVKYALPVSGALCRVFDSLPDLLVVGLRKSVYRDSPLPHELAEGTVVTLFFGRMMNRLQSFANRTWRRRRPANRDYVHLFAVLREELKENHMIIGRSLSFGLLLVGVGLCLTLIYILWQ